MAREPVRRRPMLDVEKARVLALARCRFGIRGWANRVVPELVERVQKQEAPEISEPEARGLAQAAWKYRGQLRRRGSADLVPESPPPPLTRATGHAPAVQPRRPSRKQREQQAKLERALRGEW